MSSTNSEEYFMNEVQHGAVVYLDTDMNNNFKDCSDEEVEFLHLHIGSSMFIRDRLEQSPLDKILCQ